MAADLPARPWHDVTKEATRNRSSRRLPPVKNDRLRLPANVCCSKVSTTGGVLERPPSCTKGLPGSGFNPPPPVPEGSLGPANLPWACERDACLNNRAPPNVFAKQALATHR